MELYLSHIWDNSIIRSSNMNEITNELLALKQQMPDKIDRSIIANIDGKDEKLFIKHQRKCSCKQPNMKLKEHPYIKYLTEKEEIVKKYKNIILKVKNIYDTYKSPQEVADNIGELIDTFKNINS